MSGTHFQRHLVIGTKIDGLNISSSTEIPEVDPMTILVGGSRSSGTIPFSNCGGNAHLARHHVVARQVPPEVIVQGLPGLLIDFPPPEDLQICFTVHDEVTPGGPSVPSLPPPPSVLDVNAFRPAVNCAAAASNAGAF